MSVELDELTHPAVDVPMLHGNTLAARTLRMAALRIALVAFGGGAVSYFVNQAMIEESARNQLVLTTEQTLQRESLPFREIRELEQNFLAEFDTAYADTAARKRLAHDFDAIFYRHEDGSYTQRPGLFEGNTLPDGRRFAKMSATYAPDIVPDDDVKARFALSWVLSHKYGSAAQGRLFNFYGVVPEKGFPIHQDADIAKAFVYSGPQALNLNDYEFYTRGFDPATRGTFFTKLYWDYSNNALMTTVATPGAIGTDGKRRIVACVDVLLADLAHRVAHPPMSGTHSSLFMADGEGTLIYHPDFIDTIRSSEGKASIKSLNIEKEFPLLKIGGKLAQGKVELLDNGDEIVAIGRLPETPGVLAIHYPKSMMRPAILQNLGIVAALALLTLLVEIFIIRSVLQGQVAAPLARLIRAARRVGTAEGKLVEDDLPVSSHGEIGMLARDFARMDARIRHAHDELEDKVRQRTAELEEANRKLLELSSTDGLTGIANRRRFDEALEIEWRRAHRSGGYLVLALIDVDWFKLYNDHYGHQAGDECLRNVARILAKHARRAGDLVARYGGEEFVFVGMMDKPESARRYAQAICDAVSQADMTHERSSYGRVTTSIGVAGIVPADGMCAEDLLRWADAALYRAKHEGRNRVCVHGYEESAEEFPSRGSATVDGKEVGR